MGFLNEGYFLYVDFKQLKNRNILNPDLMSVNKYYTVKGFLPQWAKYWEQIVRIKNNGNYFPVVDEQWSEAFSLVKARKWTFRIKIL